MNTLDDHEMRSLTADAPSKSEKIRILYRAGVSKADIGRFLGIRYQHVYNVLLREDHKSTGMEEPSRSAATDVRAGFFHLRLADDGVLRLPADYVAAEGLRPGDPLICRRDAGGLTIMSRAAALRHLSELARQHMPGEAGLIEALLSGESNPPSTSGAST